MPILIMALLALIIFGLIGILLTAATVLEHRKHAHAVPGGTAHSYHRGDLRRCLLPQTETSVARVVAEGQARGIRR